MSEVKIAAQKAREILGHEEGCLRSIPGMIRLGKSRRHPLDPIEEPCTCPELPLPVLVAAARGTLRSLDYKGTSPRSCEYPPLDGAFAWDLEGAIAEWAVRQDFVVDWTRTMSLDPGFPMVWRVLIPGADAGSAYAGDGNCRQEAVAALYLALHDAGLLP